VTGGAYTAGGWGHDESRWGVRMIESWRLTPNTLLYECLRSR